MTLRVAQPEQAVDPQEVWLIGRIESCDTIADKLALLKQYAADRVANYIAFAMPKAIEAHGAARVAEVTQERTVREWHRLNGEVGWTDRQVAAYAADRVQEATKWYNEERTRAVQLLAQRDSTLAQLREAITNELADFMDCFDDDQKVSAAGVRRRLQRLAALSGASSTPDKCPTCGSTDKMFQAYPCDDTSSIATRFTDPWHGAPSTALCAHNVPAERRRKEGAKP